MDFQFFLDTLLRRKWLLLSSALLAGVVTAVVMLQLPPKYRANAQVQTGIVDYKGVRLEREGSFVQKFQVDNAFSNMTTAMTGRATLGKLTEIVLAHDLNSPQPFRQPDEELIAKLGTDNVSEIQRVLVSRSDSARLASEAIVSANGTKISKLAEAYEYDFDEIRKLMEVKRIGDTDYLDISFVTESPELSVFLVEEYIKMFINDFKRAQSSAELTELDFYTERADEKKAEIDSLQSAIDAYKRGNRVVDLSEQQRSVVTQVRDIEMDIEERRKEIKGLENALREISQERATAGGGKARRNAEIAAANQSLERTKAELADLQARVDDASDPSQIERQIERKREELSARVDRVAILKRQGESKVEDRIVDLEQQELEASIELRSAKAAVQSMERESARLRSRTSSLVNDEAFLAQLATELDLLRGEYNGLIQKRDEAEVIFTRSEHPLTVVEPPEFPEKHESRHIPLVAAFSSVAMGTLVALGLFLMTLLDNRLRSPDHLRTLLDKDAEATLTAINPKKFSLGRLFGPSDLPEAPRRWIEGIRSLRYVVEQSGKRIIQVTSLKGGAGKSTVLAGLATALQRANHRVLIVDVNFKNNTLSAYSNVSAVAHPFETPFDPNKLPKAKGWFEITDIDVVGNLGGYRSLAEVLASVDFSAKLGFLLEDYDYILLESAAMDLYADSRELAEFADGILCVLDAHAKVDATGRDNIAWLDAQGDKLLGYVLNRVDLKYLK